MNKTTTVLKVRSMLEILLNNCNLWFNLFITSDSNISGALIFADEQQFSTVQ